MMDFGIARLVIQPLDDDDGITATHSIVGTPGYMAPEQLMGEEIDEMADVYSAGAVLFECVTGRSVFGECTLPALMAKHVAGELDDPCALNPSIPESLSRVILKALAEHKEARWQSAVELGRALDSVALEPDGPQPAAQASPD